MKCAWREMLPERPDEVKAPSTTLLDPEIDFGQFLHGTQIVWVVTKK